MCIWSSPHIEHVHTCAESGVIELLIRGAWSISKGWNLPKMGNAQSGVCEGVFCETTDASCCDLNGCEQVHGRLQVTGIFFENVLLLRLLHTRALMEQRSAHSTKLDRTIPAPVPLRLLIELC